MFVPKLLESSLVLFDRDDETNDIIFPLRLIGGLRAVAIGCKTRCLLCQGEWFLNIDAGIPYLPRQGSVSESQAILGNKFNPITTRQAFLVELMSTPAVIDVPTLRLNFDGPTRNLTMAWVVATQFGDTVTDTLTRTI